MTPPTTKVGWNKLIALNQQWKDNAPQMKDALRKDYSEALKTGIEEIIVVSTKAEAIRATERVIERFKAVGRTPNFIHDNFMSFVNKMQYALAKQIAKDNNLSFRLVDAHKLEEELPAAKSNSKSMVILLG